MLESVIESLRNYDPPQEDQKAAKASYLERVGGLGVKMLWKPLDSQHITASCFVFSTDLTKVLLTFHKKGQFWVQFGGHLEEEDRDLPSAALREATEESGIDGLSLTGSIVDLNMHELHGGFSCAAHWDVGYVALVDGDTDYVVSDESENVAWWPIDDLPAGITRDLPKRIEHALSALKLQQSR